MHVISKEPFDEAARRYPNDSLAIKALYRLVREKDFSSQSYERSYRASITLSTVTSGGYWMSEATT